MFPETDLLSLLPHRPPFIMVGVLLYADELVTRTGYRVEKDNLFVRDGKWLEAGLLENMAQTVAAGAGYRAMTASQPVRKGYLASVKRFDVRQLPSVGDDLVTEVIIRHQVFDMVVAEATIRHTATLIASCEMNIFIGPQSRLND